MFLEQSAKRVFQRIAGTSDSSAFGARLDFVGALQRADVWHCVEFAFNAAVLATPIVDALLVVFQNSFIGPILDAILAQGFSSTR